MNGKLRIRKRSSIKRIAQDIRSELHDNDFILIFAHNGTGKTRLSMEFKEQGKRKRKNNPAKKDTLYFNAFTEDLFVWHNDFESDKERVLKLNRDSKFFKGLEELEMDIRIRRFLDRYTDFDFRIDYDNWQIIFSRSELNPRYVEDANPSDENYHERTVENTHIKISRGEENIFIWCFFLAVVELALDESIEAYNWVKYFYIDDPISSLDDNNAIAVANDLSKLLKEKKGSTKAIISSHHSLFFNVVWNELKRSRIKFKSYFYHKVNQSNLYTLRPTDDTPFFNHVAMLSELGQAVASDKIYTYHFNMLRAILEKTATFFGYDNFSNCIHGVDDEALYSRALNLLSHGKHSIYEPKEMVEDNKRLFANIFNAFLERYRFELPKL